MINFRLRQPLSLNLLIIITAMMICSPQLKAQPANKADAATTKFSTGQLKIAGQNVTVEIADTDALRTQGLMFRDKLADGHGMLFVFDGEQSLSFWMKNTLIPLSIGYFDHNRKLVTILEMTPALASELEPKTYPSGSPVQFALEMPKGWFSKNKITVGTTFSWPGKSEKYQH